MLTINKNHSLILVVLFAMICAVAISGDVHANDATDYNTSDDWVNEYDGLEDNLTKANEDLKKANDSFNSANKSLNDSEVAFTNAIKKLDTSLSNQKKSLENKVSKYSAYKTSIKNYNTAKDKYIKAKNTYLKLLKKYKVKKTKALKNKVLNAKKTVLTLKKTVLTNRNKKNSANNAYIQATNEYYLTIFLTTQAGSEVSAKNDIVNQNIRKLTDAQDVLNIAEYEYESVDIIFTNAEQVLNSINASFTTAMNNLYDQLLTEGIISDLSNINSTELAENYTTENGLDNIPTELGSATIFTLNDTFYNSFLTKLNEILEISTIGNETFINLAKDSFLNNYTNVVMNDYFSEGYVNETIIDEYIINVINATLPSEYNDYYDEFIADAIFEANTTGVDATISTGKELMNNITNNTIDLANNLIFANETLYQIYNGLGDLNTSADNLNTTAAGGDGAIIAATIFTITDGLYQSIGSVLSEFDEYVAYLLSYINNITIANTTVGQSTNLSDMIPPYGYYVYVSAINNTGTGAIGNATYLVKSVDYRTSEILSNILNGIEALTNITNNVTALEQLGNETLNNSNQLNSLNGNLTKVDDYTDDFVDFMAAVSDINEILAELLNITLKNQIEVDS